jgi:hypothetical protein
MRKALALLLATVTAIAVSSSCSRSYYHDAEVLSAYQRQARAMCLAADAKSKLSTCRRAKACADPAQRGLEAVLVYEQASATMTATTDDRIAADAAYAGAVAACGVAGVRLGEGNGVGSGVAANAADAALDAGTSHDMKLVLDAAKPQTDASKPQITDGGTHD